MTALTYSAVWTSGRPVSGRPVAVGDLVRVDSWGKTTGARNVDVGRTGRVIALRRTRVLVALDAGNGEPAAEAAIWPACLTYRAVETAAAARTETDSPAWSAALAAPDRGAAADHAEAARLVAERRVTPASIAADVVTAARIHVIDAVHPAPDSVRLTVAPGSERAAANALRQAGWDAGNDGTGYVLAMRPDPLTAAELAELVAEGREEIAADDAAGAVVALAGREAAADAAEQASRDRAAAADVAARVPSLGEQMGMRLAAAREQWRTQAAALADDAEHDEPDDAGPLVCAECGTHRAESYVVTFLGGDQDDATGRTEVCLPCHEELTHGPAEDETVDRHTGQPLPRGRCDTCGAPCTGDTGECTRDRGHAVALDVDDPRRCPSCTYLAHDADDLAEHAAANH